MHKMKHEWETIGEIGVDAGLCWVGDPCYVLHQDVKPKDVGKDWHSFCDKIAFSDTKQFKYDNGSPGLGVCVSTGYGDGVYKVQVKKNDEGRIAQLRVKFL